MPNDSALEALARSPLRRMEGALARMGRRPRGEGIALPGFVPLFQAFDGGCMHYCGHRLQSHEERLLTEGLRGIEMGFDNPARNESYRLDRIWPRAAERKRTILGMCEGLPERRPSLRTGLI